MYDRFKNFTVYMLRISRCIQKIKSEEMSELELKGPHVSCLYYLYREGSLTATELCDICVEDKSYISHSLRYLEEKGYVACDSDAKKRYNAPFTLTELGKKTAELVAKKIDTVLAPAGDGIDEEERKILYKCLDTVTENLERISKKYD